ncbi:MAG TPA: diguanylate cyclase, partial [Euzebya sp.]|nr:diguanylate cyclase [Euzebya sp.]
VATLEVGLNGGQRATAWMIYLMDIEGVNAALLVTQEDMAVTLPDEPPQAAMPKVAIVRRDEFGQVIGFDDRAAVLLGWSPDRLDVRRSLGVHRDDHDAAITNWLHLLADPDGSYRFRARLRLHDGGYRWFDITERRRTDEMGGGYIEGELVDVDAEVAALGAVGDREAPVRKLIEAVPVGMAHLIGDRVTFANGMIREMMSADPSDDVTRLSGLRPRDRDRVRVAVRAIMDDGQARDLVIQRLEISDERRTFSMALRPVDQQDVAMGVIACLTDITESQHLRQALERRAAEVDPLTGVATRSHILSILEERLADARRGLLGVLFVDLDGFKDVNDRLGHASGDAILRTTAQRIGGVLRGDDAVGRLGGDEFLLVCPHLKDPAELEVIAKRVTASLAQPMDVADEPVVLSASIGIACVDREVADAHVIVARADAQMYQAKAMGGGWVRTAP